MAKFYGTIGYAVSTEIRPGVWSNDITERKYFGDVIRNSSRWSTSSESTNDDLTINNQISIVSDPFADQYFYAIKYVEYMGVRWKVTNVEVRQYPRLLLTLGGVYNG